MKDNYMRLVTAITKVMIMLSAPVEMQEGGKPQQLIDTTDRKQLQNLYKRRFEEWKEGKSLANKELFNEQEIVQATRLQEAFSRFKTHNEENKWYAHLQRWIDFLQMADSLMREQQSLLINLLTDNQYKTLTELANRLKLFTITIDESTMQALLSGQLQKPLKVKCQLNVLATFFCHLRISGFIAEDWQSIIQKNRCIKGKRKDDYLNSNDLSTALNGRNEQAPYYKDIVATVERLS